MKSCLTYKFIKKINEQIFNKNENDKFEMQKTFHEQKKEIIKTLLCVSGSKEMNLVQK